MKAAADLVDEKGIGRDFETLRELSADPQGGITRLAYTETETKAHQYIVSEAAKIGLTATKDDVGNLYVKIGDGKEKTMRIGSHLDSVNNGGNYDGAVGVLTGLEALRCLSGSQLKYPVELVVFRAEESSRFNRGCIASEIVTGIMTEKDMASLKDSSGVTLKDAIKKCGFYPWKMKNAKWDGKKIKLFIEPHIEQGRILETKGIPIGVVTGIAAPVRYIVTVEGRTDHSGGTPMNLRLDAVSGAAEMTLAAERIGKEALDQGKVTVMTVGNFTVPNGSINKVPGKATLYLDIRDINLKDRDEAEKKALREFQDIAKKRGLKVKFEETQRALPATLDKKVFELLVRTCEKLGVKHIPIASGASQDSQHLANYGIPTGMIFVPSKKGISHSPEEYTDIKYISMAAKILVTALTEAQNT